MMRNPGLLSEGFHDKLVSILSFLWVFFFFFQGEKCFFSSSSFSQAGLVDSFSFICALLAQVTTIYSRHPVYFIPSRSHCCTEGIFFFLFRETLMYKLTICAYRYKHQASGYCSPVDLEIWVLIFLPTCLDRQRDYCSSFKKPFKCIPVLLC